MQFHAADIVPWVQSFMWPFLRAVGFVMVAPIFGAAVVPARTKVIVALSLGFLLAPIAYGAVGQPPPIEIFSAAFFLTILNQILIGAAIGFVVELIFDALVFGGQTIAMTMGLGFATLIDAQRGADRSCAELPLLAEAVWRQPWRFGHDHSVGSAGLYGDWRSPGEIHLGRRRFLARPKGQCLV